MRNRSKSLIIITTMFLLKATDNKTILIALKRTVRASLNLIHPLTSDRTKCGDKAQDLMSQSAQEQQSPQPSCVVILDEE
jgi:hypothetical protein